MDFVPLLAFASVAFNGVCAYCLGSLAGSQICGVDRNGNGEYTAEGINALCEALKSTTTLTSLKYASPLESLPAVNSL